MNRIRHGVLAAIAASSLGLTSEACGVPREPNEESVTDSRNASLDANSAAMSYSRLGSDSAEVSGGTRTRFEVGDERLRQTLTISRVGVNVVEFVATIRGSCERTISGRATNRGGDVEIDISAEGVGVPCEQFIHESSTRCWLYLTVSIEGARTARIRETDCKQDCPFLDVLMPEAP